MVHRSDCLIHQAVDAVISVGLAEDSTSHEQGSQVTSEDYIVALDWFGIAETNV